MRKMAAAFLVFASSLLLASTVIRVQPAITRTLRKPMMKF